MELVVAASGNDLHHCCPPQAHQGAHPRARIKYSRASPVFRAWTRQLLPHAPAASPVILFGDETSLGLAAALSAQATTYMLFDVGAHAQAAIEHLRLPNAGIANDAHALEAHMSALLQAHPDADLVLTGNAGAIQQIIRLLHQHGTAAKRRQTKAYWAPGKTGMD